MSGRHRHPLTVRITSLVALVVALSAAAVMLLRPAEQHSPQATAAEVTLDQAYPGVRARPLQSELSDGAPFSPLYFVDDQRAFGTAPGPGGSLRLMMLTGDKERELRRLPQAATPEFAGFAHSDQVSGQVSDQVSDQVVVWLELVAAADGVAKAELWALDSETATPRLVTKDTGDVALFDKRDDVAVHEDGISWVAMARTETPFTEIRTVPVQGGKVRVDLREGAFAIAGWPWVSSVSLGDPGPIELRNLLTEERTVVAVQPSELMACSPTWCRALIIGSEARSTVIELLSTDHRTRLRAAAGTVAASTADVALLDRYEIYSYGDSKLVLFDLQDRKSVVLARNMTQVAARGAVLWWAEGDNETLAWHVLDLRRLAKN